MANFDIYRSKNATLFTLIPWDKSEAFKDGPDRDIFYNVTGVSTLQFYDLCVDPNDETLVIGGLQDNGFAQKPQTGMLWRNFQTGDGTSCVMNLGDPNIDWVSLAKGLGLPAVRCATADRKTPGDGA